jgi:hypothetical protein
MNATNASITAIVKALESACGHAGQSGSATPAGASLEDVRPEVADRWDCTPITGRNKATIREPGGTCPTEGRPQSLAHLERLAEALSTAGQFTAEVVKAAKPYLEVANATTPRLNERVQCSPADDDSWVFWWPWHQPIGPVDDLPTVTSKITAVLRAAGGSQ